MHRLHCIAVLLFCTYYSTAQPSDILLLKKGKKIISIFAKGTQIAFYTKKAVYKDAQIVRIYNDTVYLKEYLIQRIPTTLGFFIVDTLGSLQYAYPYTDIYKLNKNQRNFNVTGSGNSLFSGGILLTLGSTIVYLADKKSFSLPLFAAGIVAAGLGYTIAKKANKGIIIGKNKYRLHYLNMTTVK